VRIYDLERLALPNSSDLPARLGDSGFRALVGPEMAANFVVRPHREWVRRYAAWGPR